MNGESAGIIPKASGAEVPGGGSVLVTGATSQIGVFLLPRLCEAGYRVTAVSRRPPPSDRSGVVWRRGDLSGSGEWAPEQECAALVHLAGLSLLPRHIDRLADRGVRRILAFSSTSRLTKERSRDERERAVALGLAEAEEELQSRCASRGIDWTLLRPTMIYGAGIDRNISFIARSLRRRPWFPLVGGGRGRRQPVHADDLAAACVAAIFNPRTYGRIYALPGGEVLTYRAMVERIGAAVGVRPRFLPLPLLGLRAVLAIARWLPGARHLGPEMAYRMTQDLVFDASAAFSDFGYRPRRFSPERAGITGTAKNEPVLASGESERV